MKKKPFLVGGWRTCHGTEHAATSKTWVSPCMGQVHGGQLHLPAPQMRTATSLSLRLCLSPVPCAACKRAANAHCHGLEMHPPHYVWLLQVRSYDDVLLCARNMHTDSLAPVFLTSAVTGGWCAEWELGMHWLVAMFSAGDV